MRKTARAGKNPQTDKAAILLSSDERREFRLSPSLTPGTKQDQEPANNLSRASYTVDLSSINQFHEHTQALETHPTQPVNAFPSSR